MTTKDDSLFLKDKHFVNINSSDQNTQQFSNLNLNQNHSTSKVVPAVQLFSKSHTEITESPKANSYKENKESLNRSKTDSLHSKIPSSADDEDEIFNNQWNKDNTFSTTNKNNSTLSLHIIAYENSIEASPSAEAAADLNSEKESMKKEKGLTKKWKNATQTLVTALSPEIRNAFEIPRQLKDQFSTDPEVMQFKASQKLLDPNKSDDPLIQFFVKTLSGRTIVIKAKRSDSVDYVKQLINEKEGITPQRLIFAGKQMEECDKLSDYNICNLSTIHLAYRLIGGLQIYVQVLASQKPLIPLDVQKSDKIMHIKQKLEEAVSIAWNDQRIYFESQTRDFWTDPHRNIVLGEELLNDCSVSGVKLQSGSKLCIIRPKKAKDISIFVKTFKNTRIQLFVPESSTVENVLLMIQQLEGIKSEQQKKYFAGIFYQSANYSTKPATYRNNQTIKVVIDKIMESGEPLLPLNICFADNLLIPDINFIQSSEIVYYNPFSLLEKARYYFDLKDYRQCSEKLWAATFYSVKKLFLGLGIHNDSHRSTKFLSNLAIDTMANRDDKIMMRTYFKNGESFHRIFNGSETIEMDDFQLCMDSIEIFVNRFSQLDTLHVEQVLQRIIDSNTVRDDIKISRKDGEITNFIQQDPWPYQHVFS